MPFPWRVSVGTGSAPPTRAAGLRVRRISVPDGPASPPRRGRNALLPPLLTVCHFPWCVPPRLPAPACVSMPGWFHSPGGLRVTRSVDGVGGSGSRPTCGGHRTPNTSCETATARRSTCLGSWAAGFPSDLRSLSAGEKVRVGRSVSIRRISSHQYHGRPGFAAAFPGPRRRGPRNACPRTCAVGWFGASSFAPVKFPRNGTAMGVAPGTRRDGLRPCPQLSSDAGERLSPLFEGVASVRPVSKGLGRSSVGTQLAKVWTLATQAGACSPPVALSAATLPYTFSAETSSSPMGWEDLIHAVACSRAK